MGSSLCRFKWKIYMVSERVILMRARVGLHHAIFSFKAAKSAPHVNRKLWVLGSVDDLPTLPDATYVSVSLSILACATVDSRMVDLLVGSLVVVLAEDLVGGLVAVLVEDLVGNLLYIMGVF
ncbi:hypothetical protein CRG98_014679 [Punica granatum]|uniref:Uncharacterized protein n=1 Tax=Punica granatum TaxID=22663 RepID=A0A2I0K8R2_PUNGR|nr:hypothetical protein CRG98_014679 [Punica granatum]